jgi:hypothetical protein
MAVSIRVVLDALACLFLAGQCVWAHEPHDPITTVAVSPNFTQDQTVFAASDDLSIKVGAYALFKSTDGGVNWSVVEGLRNNGNMPAIDLRGRQRGAVCDYRSGNFLEQSDDAGAGDRGSVSELRRGQHVIHRHES